MNGIPAYMFFYYRVVIVINKIVIFFLVHDDPEFAPDVVFEFILIAVEMVFRDIGQDSYIRPEFHDIVQLKAADLRHVPLFRIFPHLPSKAISYISHQCAVQSAFFTDMVSKGGGGSLPIAARDTNDLTVSLVPVGQLYFADHRDAF